MRKEWPLALLSLMSIQGFYGLATGNYLQAIWLVWLSFLVYLIPEKIK